MSHNHSGFIDVNNDHFNNITKQKGSAIVVAIFVIVIMALLASALVRMQNSSSEAIVYEVMGTRAYSAAQTGIQWQLTEIFPLNTATVTLCSDNIIEPDISNVSGLENCWFEITCNSAINHDGVQYYNVKSTGSCHVAGIETSRTIQVEARSID